MDQAQTASQVRSQAEIVEHYRATQKDDVLGFTAEALLLFLDAAQFREFSRPDADLSDWDPQELTRESVLEIMRQYMVFAWEKACGHRGISASRSIAKMAAWLWLLRDDEMAAFATNDANYPQYGVPILKAICDKYDFPIPDDPAVGRMARGLPCCDDCDAGCGQ